MKILLLSIVVMLSVSSCTPKKENLFNGKDLKGWTIYVEDESVTLMILADIDKDYAEKQIFNAVNKLGKNSKELSNLNVLVKNNILQITHLYSKI